MKNQLNLTNEWDKTFPKNENVEHQKVVFHNRYGIVLVGDLYKPLNRSAKTPAIAICGPFGAVKEQSSGLYAQTLASKGFITLAFDPSFTGESLGTPRDVASPDINTEDFSAAIDYLSIQNDVDTHQLGIIGICGFGGFALNASIVDTRIKATVSITMYDMTQSIAANYYDGCNENETYEKKKIISAQRTEDYKNNSYKRNGGVPSILPNNVNQSMKDYFDYYKTKRGYHKNSVNSNNGWNTTSAISFINMPILIHADKLINAALLIHGENAHSLHYTTTTFAKLKGSNKELLIIPHANHTDLYDNLDKIPFDKIAKFMHQNFI